ncbi:hypothetical protein [Quatrionicoccus australiensis]|uniref:hypothetical protein n=1 Tax=Quatrionicoccus australiensis TaxID=138118 RepID=UPI001CFBE464|nr:hypothetical protein [Quatrionicoccus australiensis]MCB4359556.1 hypothetical protein [Quatrionicoccus australiensis]
MRYSLSAVIAWMASFKDQDSTVMFRETGPWPPSAQLAHEMAVTVQPGTFPGAGPVPSVPTFKAWLNCPVDSIEKWPVVSTKAGLMDAFKAMSASGRIKDALDGVRWITRDEWPA